MLVDEVEPEKTAHAALVGIGPSRKDVPWRGNREKNQRTGNQTHLKKMAQIAREEKKQADRGHWENQADQALGQHVQSAHRREPPAGKPRGRGFAKGPEEDPEWEDQPKSHEDIRNQESRKNVRAEGQAGRQGGIDASCFAERPSAKKVNGEQQREDSESERKPCRQ